MEMSARSFLENQTVICNSLEYVFFILKYYFVGLECLGGFLKMFLGPINVRATGKDVRWKVKEEYNKYRVIGLAILSDRLRS